VFKCGSNIFWIYLLAQLVAAVGACCIFAFVSGWGPLMPLKARTEYGMSQAEAIRMWITGKTLLQRHFLPITICFWRHTGKVEAGRGTTEPWLEEM
jgi:hypothetical protein